MQLSLLGAPPEPPLPLLALRRAEPCTVSLVTDRRAFDALADQWRVIEATARGAVLFQSYDWCRAVWDHWLGKARPFEPRILIARRGSETVGILPLRIVRRGPLRIATGLAEPFQQYSDAILSPDQGHDVVDALLGAALRLDACDGIELLKVRDDSPLAGVAGVQRRGPSSRRRRSVHRSSRVQGIRRLPRHGEAKDAKEHPQFAKPNNAYAPVGASGYHLP